MKLKNAKNLINLYASFLTNKARIRPNRAGWFITNLCNSRCIKCEIWKTKPKNSKELSLKDAKRIIDNIHDFGIDNLSIVGGEPFVYKHIFAVIKYVSNKGIKVDLSTNALALNEKKIDRLIKSGINKLGFSMDGFKAETHDNMVGVKGAHKKMLKNIRYFVSQKGAGFISTVISPKNADELINLYFLAGELGLEGVVYQPFQYIPSFIKTKNIGEFDYGPHIKKIDYIIDKLVHLKKNGDLKIFNSVSYLNKIKHFIRNEKMTNFCLEPYCRLTIDSCGNMVPCTPCQKKLGNLIKTPMEKLWNSEEFIKARKELKNSKICRSCLLSCTSEHTPTNSLFEIIKNINHKNLFKS